MQESASGNDFAGLVSVHHFFRVDLVARWHDRSWGPNGTFYGYKSANRTNWTLVNSRSITMATNIYVGLAVASGTSNVLNSATFTNLTVIP